MRERYWKKLQPAQQNTLLIAAQGKQVANTKHLNVLAYRALVYTDHGRYKPFSEMFGEYILQQQSKSQQDSDSSTSDEKASNTVLSNAPIIIEKKRRLQALRIKEARYGKNTPPEIIIEIEDLNNELANLQGY